MFKRILADFCLHWRGIELCKISMLFTMICNLIFSSTFLNIVSNVIVSGSWNLWLISMVVVFLWLINRPSFCRKGILNTQAFASCSCTYTTRCRRFFFPKMVSSILKSLLRLFHWDITFYSNLLSQLHSFWGFTDHLIWQVVPLEGLIFLVLLCFALGNCIICVNWETSLFIQFRFLSFAHDSWAFF